MLAYSILPKPETKTTSNDAYTLLLNDLAQQGIARDEIQIFNFTGSGGVWTTDVIVTRAPHSKCPTSEKRSYSDVLSFKYRPEQLIKDCAERSPIVLREEAIIDSGVIPQTAGADYACAFSAEEIAHYDNDEALAYCPLVSSADLLSFAQDVPTGSWAIQWNKNDATIFVALDAYGNVLKTS